MKKMKRLLCVILCGSSVSSLSRADWVPESAAPYSILNSSDDITVDKAGLSTSVREVEMKVLNEQGRNQLVIQSIPFIPDAMKIEVLKASSITDGIESSVDVKKVTIRTAGGSPGGISNVKEVLIPYNNIKIGSITKYTVRMSDTKVLVKGLYSAGYSFGVSTLEMAGKAKIRSFIPIYVKINDPWNILVSKEYKDGNYFVFEFEQKKPIFKIPSEFNPILRNNMISMVEVSTMNNWGTYVGPISEKYEKILEEKGLPPSFEKIVEHASKARTVNEKIDRVTSELATIMTYSGDWTSFDKMFFPKKISEIGKLKVGDCKDFSLATVAMLRKMGLQANVAMTMRKSGGGISGKGLLIVEPISTSLVRQNFFNHAIVKVKVGGEIIWVDPTNIVSNSSFPFNDIAGSYALELIKSAKDLEKIPHPALGQSLVTFDKSIKVNADNTVESITDFEMTGDYAKYVVEGAFTQNEEMAHKIMMAFLRTDAKSAKSLYEGINLKNRIAASLKGKQKSFGESLILDKESKKYFLAPLALSIRGLTSIGVKRVTDMNLEGTFFEKSVVRVKGYDFIGFKEGCTILSPWFTIRRKFLKDQDGFQVHDLVELKKIEVPAGDVNSDKFQMSVGDIAECAGTQAVEIRKLDLNETLASRLKEYTYEKAKSEYDISGPKSITGARNALHIAEQILSKDIKNKDALVLKARAIRKVGYKNESIDRSEYFDESDVILADLENKFPQDPQVLMQKAWGGYHRNNQNEMMTYFKKAFAVSGRNWELYNLGANISEKLGKTDAALGSYAKALELAQTSSEKGSAAVGVAEMYFKKQQNEKAISYYKYAISANPENTWVAGNFMIILQGMKKWDEAITTGEEIMKTSAYGIGRRLLADAYAGKAKTISSRPVANSEAREKNEQEAEGYLAKGLQHSPTNEACLSEMAQLYFERALKNKDSMAAQRALSYIEKATADGKMQSPQLVFMKMSLEHLIAGKNVFADKPRLPAAVISKERAAGTGK